MSHKEEAAPAWRAPALSCDSHFHVFGSLEQYPVGGDLRYKPPYAPLEEYLALARGMGFERFVFVQPSAYGRDNRCMLDAMREMDPKVVRGIVDIDEDIPDAELAKLNSLGVRGVRINVSPIHKESPGFAEAMLPRIRRIDARCAEIGWHLDFLGPGWLTSALMPTMQRMKCDFSIAHMGMYLAKDGVQQPGFQALLDMLKHGDGRCWVKFTGTYRMSEAPRFAGAKEMAQAILAAASDRVIWGSDYPHLSFADKVGSVELFNLLGEWAPDEATRKKVLVDNPGKLFGF
jgi:predicted TIM-barrel fold metal-dependent hydrolase